MTDVSPFPQPAPTGGPAPTGAPADAFDATSAISSTGVPAAARRRPTGFERNDEPEPELSWWERLPRMQRIFVIAGCALALIGIAGAVFGARGLSDSSGATAESERLTDESSKLTDEQKKLQSEAFAEVTKSLELQAAVEEAFSAATSYRTEANRVIDLTNTAVDLQTEGQAAQAEALVQGDLTAAVNAASAAQMKMVESLGRIREELP